MPYATTERGERSLHLKGYTASPWRRGADPLPLAPGPGRAEVFAILRREAASGTMEAIVVITGGEFSVPALQEFLSS